MAGGGGRRRSGGRRRGKANPSGAAAGNCNGHHHDDRGDDLPDPEEGGGGNNEVCRNGAGNHHDGGGVRADCFGDNRDRDRDRAGPSKPADLRQAKPPLAASDDELEEEPAAVLLQEFEALGIHVRRAGPVLPPRPGYGAAGRPCVVRANRFLARLADEGLHHYDVSARRALSLFHCSLLVLI
jgi:eukaryotic translation initiation factor 2C